MKKFNTSQFVLFLMLAAVASVVAGCSKGDEKSEKPAIPLVLSATARPLDDGRSVYTSGIFEVGETKTIEITSGNGGYTITPKTVTFYREDESAGAARTDYTISGDDVVATIEDNKIVLKRVRIPDSPAGAYIISDSRGKTAEIDIPTPGWLGEL
jgi:hypothetical protein